MTRSLGNATLDQLLFQAICPREYLQNTVSLGLRQDKRRLNDMRKLNIQSDYLQSCDSSCIVRLGSTVVTCGIRLEVSEPLMEQKFDLSKGENFQLPTATGNESFLVINFSFPHSSLSNQMQQEQAQQISTQLKNIYSKSIDFKRLTIEDEDLVWCLYVDLVALNTDGSLLTACTIATTTVLSKLHFPKIAVDPLTNVITMQPNKDKSEIPLLISHPIAFTFGAALQSNSQSAIFVDLSQFEEDTLDVCISIVLCENEQINSLLSLGQLEFDLLETFLALAKQQYSQVITKIKE